LEQNSTTSADDLIRRNRALCKRAAAARRYAQMLIYENGEELLMARVLQMRARFILRRWPSLSRWLTDQSST